MTFFGRIGAVVRGLVGRFSYPDSAWSFLTGRSKIDYAGRIGDGSGNSAVMACINAVCTGFLEARLVVRRTTEDGDEEIPNHPLVALLRRPNPHMSGRLLWMAALMSLHLDGNAYWIKLRSAGGRVVELWPIFPHQIEPVWEDGDFITAYEYNPGADRIFFDPRDVVHFRLALDPANARKGLSPLKAVAREIYTDNEAGDFAAQLLTNLGVPGVLITPDTGGMPINQAAADRIKGTFAERFAGDGRGGPMVLSSAAKVEMLSFSPEQMTFDAFRAWPEARIAGVLGVPPIIAGLNVGLERSTFSNYAEAREAFYETKLIPIQGLIADDLYRQLLPDFAEVADLLVTFDVSNIRVLQEDEDKRQRRIWESYDRGIMTLKEARLALHLDPDVGNQDVYVRIGGREEVRVEDVGAEKPPPPPPMLLPPAPDALPDAPRAMATRGLFGAQAKARRDHVDRVARVRAAIEPAFEKAVAESLEAQAGRVARRLGRKGAEGIRYTPSDELGIHHKALPDDLLPKSEDGRLAADWRPHYTALLADLWPLFNRELGVDLAFALDDPMVIELLEKAGERVVGINDTTRQAIATALGQGALLGEGSGQLAARVRRMVEESYAGRAETIARTELALAQQQATVGRYKAAGVTRVRVLDGDDDAACASVHNTIQDLDWAEKNSIAHPRCVRAFAAIIDGAEEAA